MKERDHAVDLGSDFWRPARESLPGRCQRVRSFHTTTTFPYIFISVYSVYCAILDIDSVHQAGKLDGSL